MTHAVAVGMLTSLWFGVGLAAQQSGLSPLRASIERERMRLTSTRAVDDLSLKDSTGVETVGGSTQRPGDWSAVQRLRLGTRVRITTRQGPGVTGRVTAVTESGLQLGALGAVLREDVSTVRLPHRRVIQYVGLGLLFGGAGGLALGAASECDDCELRGLATVVGAVYGATGGAIGGWMVGNTLNDRPERLVYAR